MLRDIRTKKWFIGGFGFLIVFAALCYFWYQHKTASFHRQLPAIDDITLQVGPSQKAEKPEQTTEQAGALLTEQLESVEDTSVPTQETSAKTDTPEKNRDFAADVPTSSFGFGPYPEVPVDFPFQEQLWENATPEHELLVRVRVKLWKQGTQTTGAAFDNNGLILVVPCIPGHSR